MGEKGRRNNPEEITSPCIPSCVTSCPVEMEIQDQCFLSQPRDRRNKPRNLLAASLQSSSALGFEEQLCFCFPGRATVSSQWHGFTVSALARKLTSEKKVAPNKRPDTSSRAKDDTSSLVATSTTATNSHPEYNRANPWWCLFHPPANCRLCLSYARD